MKTIRTVGALAIVLAVVIAISSPANAVMWTPGDGSNIIDCRSGWYCTTGGWINWGSSWDHIWSGWADNFAWGW